MEVVDLPPPEMVARVVVVLVEVLVAHIHMDTVVIMVVEVVVQITIMVKMVMVEMVPLGLFGALEENFQIPLLMINNI